MFSSIREALEGHIKSIIGFIVAVVTIFVFYTTGVINNIVNIGQAAPLDVLMGTISWLVDLMLRTIVMVVDKITVAVDMVFKLINMLYQMTYQFLHQSITAIIDRCIEFYARKPWGSISETPLAMRTRQKVETYFSIKSRNVIRRLKNQS